MDGPQTDDQLHAYIKQNLGLDIPRVAVCDDHDAPFDFIADVYFHRLEVIFEDTGEAIPVNAILVLATRGGAKTTMTAVLHFLFSTFKPGNDSLQFGSSLSQGERCYNRIEDWCYKHDETGGRLKEVQDFILDRPMKSQTVWRNGSRVEVVAGSEGAVSGPHCSPGDELVLTSKGYKRIDQLDPKSDCLASLHPEGNETSKLTWGTIHGKIKKGKNSIYSGVHWNNGANAWIAQVCDDVGQHQRKDIGRFDTAEEAHECVVDWQDQHPKIAYPFSVQKRKYSGNLIVIETENSQARVTPNHTIRIKLKEEFDEKWVVYLMRKGNWWRIGLTKGHRTGVRINEERADDLWIIKTFDDHVEALEHEIYLQAYYGLPALCFRSTYSNARVNHPEWIHEQLSEFSEIRAMALLEDYDMFADIPFRSTSRIQGRKLIRGRRWIDTSAGNALNLEGCFYVPETTDDFENLGNSQPPIASDADIYTEPYSGWVFSLDIKPYHYYVSGGIVVHNSNLTGADEIDLMDRPVWIQSRGITAAKQATGPLPEFMDKFNGVIPPIDVITSTRNSTVGLMQELIVEYDEDIKAHRLPQFTRKTYCIFECLQEVPSCRCADKEDRKSRLKELGRDEEDLCQCNKVAKGFMEDGTPRTLDKVCEGKAFRSRGWKPYVDFISSFKRTPPGTWKLQYECREGIDEHNYIQDWSQERYGIRHYQPKPEYGPIYQGLDWGGKNPFCALWVQYLSVDVPAYDYEYNPIYLSAGTYVLFKEVYIADIDTAKFAERVELVESKYRSQFGHRWKVKSRFMDPQGRADRIYFARKGMPGSWPVKTREKEFSINVVQNLVIDDRFAVDVDSSPMFCEEVAIWQRDPKTDKEVDKFNHAVSSWRYCIANAEVLNASKTAKTTGRRERGQKIDKPRNMSGSSEYLNDGEPTAKTKKIGPVQIIGPTQHPVDQFSLR